MFLFKKIMAYFLFPFSISFFIMLSGIILLWFSRKQKNGKIFVSIGFIFLAVFSISLIPEILLKSLEDQYLPFDSKDAALGVKWVVVLGGGHISDPKLPITSQISEASLVRLVEGIRLHKKLLQSTLLLSGGSTFDPLPNALIMAKVALELGVDDKSIVLETISKDTKDEAVHIKKIVGKDKFVLVTSASHMPRSMAIFSKMGMQPIPAPTNHKILKKQGVSPFIFFPNAESILIAKRAFYEYLGLIWAKIMNQI